MNITILGTGYVGLVSGTCFSEFGFDVCCVDKDKDKINNLKNDIIPIYEPGLQNLVKKNKNSGRLSFSNDIDQNIKKADIVFIAVGTPSRRGDGHADLTYVYEAAEKIAKNLDGYTVIVNKSTVPVGTGAEVKNIIKKINPDALFDVVSNPEFLREGNAIEDFMRPDRVVVGIETEKAKQLMSIIYKPLYLIETPILFTDLNTAELIKYSANAFLAVKISYINQMSDLCEKVGADVHDVAKGIGLDKRIGSKFLHPGPGYGGSCFPKDTIALVQTAKEYDSNLSIVETVVQYNKQRKSDMADKIIEAFNNNCQNKKISILGLSFKPETDDMRDSPSLDIIPILKEKGFDISVFDPVAMDEAKKILKNIEFSNNIEECLQDSDGLVILTEWNEFRGLSATRLKKVMKGNILVDLRNSLNPESFQKSGFNLIQLGRPKKTNL
ncbi:UDP-glucose/GDP-mannose dehydrogenase family protein [Candidatus Levibacter sp. Uisw_134_01]|uniref:UDP-glucose dehydrogenase family protein n=1 Tax=Candidatus Levibacter sp. Uisw_134_01 TaxID=3230999 RepID=UPI003D37FD85